MKAFEFLGSIQNNQIQVPLKFSSGIKNPDNKRSASLCSLKRLRITGKNNHLNQW